MYKFSKILFIIFLNLVCLHPLVSSSEEKIKIGLLVPLTGDNKEIGHQILKSIKLDPFNYEFHYAAGRIQSDLGQFEKATESLKKSINLAPEFGGSYYRLGIVNDNLNKGVEAISNFLIAEIIYHKMTIFFQLIF